MKFKIQRSTLLAIHLLSCMSFANSQENHDIREVINNVIRGEFHGINNNFHNQTDILKAAMKEMNERMKVLATDKDSLNRVVILGPTGSGKTVLLNYLAGKKLVVEDYDGEPRIRVIDPLPGSNVGHNIQAGTTYPCAWVGPSNTVFWDCPGFEDARGPVQEIINTFAIYKLFSGRSKILLAVPESVLREPRMQNFLRLVNRITEIFSEEIYTGLSLVITQQGFVPRINPYKKIGSLLRGDNALEAVYLLNPPVKKLIEHLSNNETLFSNFPYPECSENGDYSPDYSPRHRSKILESINAAQFLKKPNLKSNLPAEARELVTDLGKAFNNHIIEVITKSIQSENVFQKIVNECIRKITKYSNPLTDIEALKVYLTDFDKSLGMTDQKNPEQFINGLGRFFNSETYNEIKESIENLTFLKQIKGDISYQVNNWFHPINPIISQIKEFSINPVSFYMRAANQRENANSQVIAQNALGMLYENGLIVLKSYEEALKWYTEAAMQGYDAAQLNLARMYENGQGVKKNDKEAIKWCTKAAEQGNAVAQLNLGRVYENGQGVEKNNKEAINWYTKAAKQENAIAQFHLGRMYENGQGVEKNNKEAAKWYAKSASQSYADAQFHLGRMYENGQGVEKNSKEAVKWYTESANQNYADAQFNLGQMYENGQGVEKNSKEAMKWYIAASELRYAPAQNRLGTIYFNGIGVPKNVQEAANWYTKAANQGNASAQNALAFMYQTGSGLQKDPSKAIKWYTKAANQGHAGAQNSLGEIYLRLFKDVAEAVKWLMKASEQNLTDAQYTLGGIYESNNEFQNLFKAKELYEKAAHQGHTGAQVKLGSIYCSDGNASQALKWYQEAANCGDSFSQYSLGNMYEKGKGVSRNLFEAAQWYKKSANQGYAAAQYKLGVLYEVDIGDNFMVDLSKAQEWYKKSSDQGYAAAQNALGVMYEKGNTGVDKDISKAIDLYTKAANQGYTPAQNNLGVIYQDGIILPKNTSVAFDWFMKAASQGYAPAQNALGLIYQGGIDVPKNSTEAFNWFMKAANQQYVNDQIKSHIVSQHNFGVINAQFNIGSIYWFGDGVQKDYAQSTAWFEKAAGAGHTISQYYLGMIYENGNSDVMQNLPEAVRWYREAAKKQHLISQYKLATIYEKGASGVAQNLPEAVKWYTEAAKQEHIVSQHNLAAIYEKGVPGVWQNLPEAVKWYVEAANRGYAAAQNNLGLMYEKGSGVAKNLTEAFNWFMKAANQEYRDDNKPNIEDHVVQHNRSIMDAQNNLGRMYENGTAYKGKNLLEAVKWYMEAANRGYAFSQYNLGTMYEKGLGVSKDLLEAEKWYAKAANQGYTTAKNHLPVVQRSIGVMFEGIKDYPKAEYWYTKAAMQGLITALINLGRMYLNDNGSKNISSVIMWLEREYGNDVEAAVILGDLYLKYGDDLSERRFNALKCYEVADKLGDIASQTQNKAGDLCYVLKKYTEAVEWYKKAADQGYPNAQYNLGAMYLNGDGVPKNIIQAIGLLEKAAAQDIVEAQLNLGKLYLNGDGGVPKSEVQARKWFMKAAEQGSNIAKELIKRMNIKVGY